MGVVMLGMTAGIATGPAIAGVLTGWIGWRAPFLLVSAGCLAAFLVGRMAMPGGRAPTAATVPAAQPAAMAAQAGHRAPLLAKGLWNGRVSPPFCCRRSPAPALCPGRGPGRTEHCRIRHRTRRGQSFRRRAATPGLRRGMRAGHHQCAARRIGRRVLPAALALVGRARLSGRLGSIPGAGAPLATTVLASRSDRDKGAGGGGNLNNLSILSFLPLAATLLAQGKPTLAATVFLAGLGLGAVLTVHDAVRANRRSSGWRQRKLMPSRSASARVQADSAPRAQTKGLAQNMS